MILTPGNSLLLLVCVTHRPMNFTMATMANQATEAATGKNKPHFWQFQNIFWNFSILSFFFSFFLQVISRKLRRSSQHGWLCVAWSSHRYRYAETAMFSKRHFLRFLTGLHKEFICSYIQALLIDAVLWDSFTSVHLSDILCNVNSDFFCRHSLGIPFSL